MTSFSCRSARLRSSHSRLLEAILMRQCASESWRRMSLRMRFSMMRALLASFLVSALKLWVRWSVLVRYAWCACSKLRSSSSIVLSRLILSTLYSSLLRFLISSRSDSNSCRESASASANSASIAAIMSSRSFFCFACAFTISVRSVSNSSSSARKLLPNSSSKALMRMYCRSKSLSTMIMWDRSAIWNCSSASSKSRSSIWMMASLRSTSRSWFCDRISISLRRSSTLASRMIFLHWL
mmetsp:Transcript_4338/g.14998  ORF Transcript_4338/g.14998 Transcript_4338/m.14998 type:complete len:239 (-) Transcript_4338:233-949(-)